MSDLCGGIHDGVPGLISVDWEISFCIAPSPSVAFCNVAGVFEVAVSIEDSVKDPLSTFFRSD